MKLSVSSSSYSKPSLKQCESASNFEKGTAGGSILVIFAMLKEAVRKSWTFLRFSRGLSYFPEDIYSLSWGIFSYLFLGVDIPSPIMSYSFRLPAPFFSLFLAPSSCYPPFSSGFPHPFYAPSFWPFFFHCDLFFSSSSSLSSSPSSSCEEEWEE